MEKPLDDDETTTFIVNDQTQQEIRYLIKITSIEPLNLYKWLISHDYQCNSLEEAKKKVHELIQTLLTQLPIAIKKLEEQIEVEKNKYPKSALLKENFIKQQRKHIEDLKNVENLFAKDENIEGGKRSAKGRKRMTTKGGKRMTTKGRKRSSTKGGKRSSTKGRKRSSTKRSSTKRAIKKRM